MSARIPLTLACGDYEIIRPLKEGTVRPDGIDLTILTAMDSIMHVLGIKPEIVDRHPWIPINLYHAFNQAKSIAMKRMENPRIVPLVWYREAWEEQEELVGADPWEYGATERNLKNINAIAGYCHEQGMTKRKFSFDDLFAPVFQGRKRGDEFRF